MEIDPTDNQAASSDEDADGELMKALGQEVRAYFDEQMSILLARIDSRLDAQQEILNAIRGIQNAMTAPRMLVQDKDGKPIGIRTLSS